MEYYSGMKKNWSHHTFCNVDKPLKHYTKWKKAKHRRPYIILLNLYEMPRISKSIKTEADSGCQGLEEEANWEQVLSMAYNAIWPLPSSLATYRPLFLASSRHNLLTRRSLIHNSCPSNNFTFICVITLFMSASPIRTVSFVRMGAESVLTDQWIPRPMIGKE